MDRSEAIKRIKAALKRKSGRTWSVTGGRGTAWGWLNVDVLPAQRTWHHDATGERDANGYPVYQYVNDPSREFGEMSPADQQELALLFGLDRPVHPQGLSFSSDLWDWYVERAEAAIVAVATEQ